jgi:hypothetical protein
MKPFSFKSIPNVQEALNAGGTGSVPWYNYWRGLGTINLPFPSLEDFGAKPDGSDSYKALMSGVDKARSLGINALFIPPGIWDLGTQATLTIGDFALFGIDRKATRIRALSGSTLTNLLLVGDPSGNNWNTQFSVRGITFDGNGTCSDSVLKFRNMGYSDIHEIRCTGGSGHGFSTDTRDDTDTLQVRNIYSDIIADDNGSKGIYTIGEKDGQFDKLFAYDNTGDGIHFRAFKHSNVSAETTQCVMGTLLARDNGGDGVVLDGTEKFTIAAILTAVNTGYGVRIRNSDTGVTIAGSNNFNIGIMSFRNNRTGGFRQADSSQLNGGIIGNVRIIGTDGVSGGMGFELAGATGVHIGSLYVTGAQGTAVRFGAGTPMGNATECQNIKCGPITLSGNGVSGSSSGNHGLWLNDATHDVTIQSLTGSNNFTTGTDYELHVGSSVRRISIGDLSLSANNSGNEYDGIENVSIGRYSHRGADPIALVNTAVGLSVPGHASLYIDVADGDLKTKFANGTVKTIETN